MTDEPKDTSSATWKFKFIATVNADPRANGVCLGIIAEFLCWCSKGDPRAFRSLPDLMLATGSSRPTVKKAIKSLVSLGYLQPLFITEGGAMMYRLFNAREELIADHLGIAKQTLSRARADRKKQERRARRVKETCPPHSADGERNLPPKVKETCPNTVELNRIDTCSEGNGGWEKDNTPSNDNPYSLIDDDPTIPFDIPSDDDEAEEILSHVGNVHPVILRTLRRMLMAGELTPALLQANLGGGHGSA